MVKPTIICLVIFIIVFWCWHTNQLEFHNAFLNEILQEEMYIEQPLSFVHFTLSSHVFHLNKFLDGLKWPSWTWYNCLNDYLLFVSFKLLKLILFYLFSLWVVISFFFFCLCIMMIFCLLRVIWPYSNI